MNLFLQACAAAGPIQLKVECQGRTAAERVAFDLPFLLVGRDPRTDLHFDDEDVSKRHLYLQMIAGHLFCVDLGSRIGTYLGGRCRRSGWADRRRTIRIGPYRLHLVDGDDGSMVPLDGTADDPFRPSPRLSSEPPLPGLTLELTRRGTRPTRLPVGAALALVGRSADCAVRLSDPSVSNYHCSLVRTPSGAWVVDLLGRGGVAVNGQGVRYARIHDGDVLQVGQSTIHLRPESPRSAQHPSTGLARRPPSAPAETAPAPIPSTQLATADARRAIMDQAESDSLPVPFGSQQLVLAQQQQQMFGQFCQTMTTMFQSFASFQQEQMGTIRQELDHLRSLTQELARLQGELLASQSQPAASPTRSGPRELTPRLADTPPPEPKRRPRPGDQQEDQLHRRISDRIAVLQTEQQGRWQKILSLVK